MANMYENEPTPALLDIASNTAEVLFTMDAKGAADLVAELAIRLQQHELVAELAGEGIGQRPPIALLLSGREPNSAVVADAAAELTLNGFIVLPHQPPADLDDEDLASMAALLRQKIDLADVVNIANADGIDVDLLPFIDYAETTSTPVQYTNPDA